MNKNIEYYLDKFYRIEIREIPEEEGGGFVASLPQFGHSGIIADGDTPEEAVKELEIVKELRFRYYLDEGLDIPLPEEESSSDDFSGKFITRVPSFLHRELANEAKKSGVSVNLLVNNLLSAGLERERTFSYIEEVKQAVESLKENICDLKYNIESNSYFKFPLLSEYAADEPDEYKAAA